GIDVTSISHIINYDIPQSSDDYVHRVGRTGRMGREGVAYTFVTREEGDELTRIEMLINKVLSEAKIEGLEAARPAQKRAAAAIQYFGAGAQAAAANGASPDDGSGEAVEAPAEPAVAKPAPFGRRGRTKHRRGL